VWAERTKTSDTIRITRAANSVVREKPPKAMCVSTAPTIAGAG